MKNLIIILLGMLLFTWIILMEEYNHQAWRNEWFVNFKLKIMFYCDKCKKEKGYPESLMKSYGKCEICGTHAECYDVPSHRLPNTAPLKIGLYDMKDSLNEPEDYPELMSEFILDMKSFSHETQIKILAFIADDLSLDVTATAIRDSINK